MAGRKYEPEEIVADVVVYRRVQIGNSRFLRDLEFTAEFFVLALEHPGPAQPVDRAAFRRCHEPGTRIVRDTRLRPPFKRRDERILCEILGQTDVTHDARKAGDELCGLDPPDRIYHAVGFRNRHARKLVLRERKPPVSEGLPEQAQCLRSYPMQL